MKNSLFVILILSMAIMNFSVKLNPMYSWKYIDYLWESPQQKQEAINSGNYKPGSALFEYVDEAPDGRIFLTGDRRKEVPVSIITVSNEKGEGGLLLRPYPDWSWHTNKKCEGITGAYGIDIKCNHIFVMDSGYIEEEQVCPPQVLIFDLSTDQLVKRIIIPSNVAINRNGINGTFTTIHAVASHCNHIKDNAILLIADGVENGLVVYNPHISKFCRIESEFMKPTNATFTIENITFNFAEGITHLATTDKDLYYAAFSADKLYRIEISKLIDCSLSDREASEITQLVGTLSGQTGPIAFEECAIIFSNQPATSIMCADATKFIDFNNMEVVVQNPEELQCIAGTKIINKSHFKRMLILTTRCHRYMTTGYNLNETNHRIFSINMTEIRKANKNCFASCN
ncbi:major royal jelly protein 1 isoform X2 [Monomorium pharaonis]|uniref:major royal jelly protein 1 isoform X2 n=1 Tax=Monomorium pharaonis TaxID=307658 RepID=UPI00174612B1|nr:major royal jelly protein 1 isoform X2 [Monomorium pharaonis]